MEKDSGTYLSFVTETVVLCNGICYIKYAEMLKLNGDVWHTILFRRWFSCSFWQVCDGEKFQ